MNTAEIKFIKSFAINYTKGLKYQFHPIRKIDDWWYDVVIDNITRIRNTCDTLIRNDDDGDSLKAPMFIMQMYKKNIINQSVLCDDDFGAYEILSRKANAKVSELLRGYNSDIDDRIKKFRKNSVVIRTTDLHYDNAMYDKFFTVSIDNKYFSQIYFYMKDACDILLNFLKEYKYKITSPKGWNKFEDAVMLNYENFHEFVIDKFSKYKEADLLAMQNGIRSSCILTRNQQESSILLYKALKIHLMYKYPQERINRIKHELCALVDSTDANAYVLTEEKNQNDTLVGHISVLGNYFNTHVGEAVFTDRMHIQNSTFITINTESMNKVFKFSKDDMGLLVPDFAYSPESPNNCIRAALMMCVNDPYLGYSTSNKKNVFHLLKHGELLEDVGPDTNAEINMDLTKTDTLSSKNDKVNDMFSSYNEFKQQFDIPSGYTDIGNFAKKFMDDLTDILAEKKISIPQNVSTYSTSAKYKYSDKGLNRLFHDLKSDNKEKNAVMEYMINIIENMVTIIEKHGIIEDVSDLFGLSKFCRESLNNKIIPVISNFTQYLSIKDSILLQYAGVLSESKSVMIVICKNDDVYSMYQLNASVISTIVSDQFTKCITDSNVDYPLFVLGNKEIAIGLKNGEKETISKKIWKDTKEFSYDIIRLLEGTLMWLHIMCANNPSFTKNHRITLENPSFLNILDVIENNTLFNDIDDINAILFAFGQVEDEPNINHNILLTTPSGKYFTINENGYKPQTVAGKGMFDFMAQFRLTINEASLVIPSCKYTSSDEFETDFIKILKYMKHVKETNEKVK